MINIIIIVIALICFFNIFLVSDSQEKEEEQIPAVDRTPENNKNPLVPPKPLRALIRGESVGSSIVKYKITTTPGYV